MRKLRQGNFICTCVLRFSLISSVVSELFLLAKFSYSIEDVYLSIWSNSNRTFFVFYPDDIFNSEHFLFDKYNSEVRSFAVKEIQELYNLLKILTSKYLLKFNIISSRELSSMTVTSFSNRTNGVFEYIVSVLNLIISLISKNIQNNGTYHKRIFQIKS